MNSSLRQGLRAHFSEQGLERLASVRVGIAGAGGLGSNVAMLLVRSGVRQILVVDGDSVEPSNLNRQFYWPEDLGLPKVAALQRRLLDLEPSMGMEARQEWISAATACGLFHGCSIVVEALDTAGLKADLCTALLGGGFFVVAASGLGGYGLPPMTSRRLGTNFVCVGDFSTAVDSSAPPLAPRVTQAAALQADAVLAEILGDGERMPPATGGRGKRLFQKSPSPSPGHRRHLKKYISGALMYLPFPDTDIYALTDSRQSLGRSTVEVVAKLLEAGIKVIQYREKDKDAGLMLGECQVIREMTRKAGCCFIVNDHVDIALLCEADGVHVGQEDLPLAAVRRLVGGERVIGISTHKPDEARAAVDGGADYIGVGPIFATATKSTAKPVGFSYLEEIAGKCPIPFTAIGGLNERTLADVVRRGARCCAIVSAITLAEDIPAKVEQLRTIIREAGYERDARK